MKYYRIKALLMRNITLTFRGIDSLIDFFYWPFFDIVLWGFSSCWIQPGQPVFTSGSLLLFAALILWQASYRASFDVSFNILAELWSRNIVNMFATPLTIGEWLTATMLLGIINTFIGTLFGLLVVILLHKISVLAIGWLLIPLIISLIISGWAIGLLTGMCVIYWGQRAQKLVWIMGWLFVPFSAVYYPVGVLPHWAQVISRALPMTYIFEGLRNYIEEQKLPHNDIYISFALNSIYFFLVLILFYHTFEKSRSMGLARLENA